MGRGVRSVGQTGTALEGILAKVADISGLVGEIAASAQEQAIGLIEVNRAVNQMDQVTQQNAAMVEESTAASHALNQEADELNRLLAHFNIGPVDHPHDVLAGAVVQIRDHRSASAPRKTASSSASPASAQRIGKISDAARRP